MKNDIIIRRLSLAVIFVSLVFLAIYFYEQNFNQTKILQEIPDIITQTDQNPTKDPLIDKLTIAQGFAMQTFASNLRGARAMIFDPNNKMIVSQTSEGRISLISDNNTDGISDQSIVLAFGLSRPHGLAINCPQIQSSNELGSENCTLYVAEQSRLTSFLYNPSLGTVSEKKKLLDLPFTATDKNPNRSLLFLPESNILLISISSSCNVCEETNNMRAKVMAYNITTQKVSEYARGLRNTSFMTLSPIGQIFATEQSRDGLGDNLPPEEINIIEPSKNYGWPICYGKNIHDDVYDNKTYIRNPCMEPFETSSFIDLPAHSLPLGLTFIPESWGSSAGDLLVVMGGSWNISGLTGNMTKTGPAISHLFLDEFGNYTGKDDFVSGWQGLGSPVDLAFDKNGTLFLSDEQNGNIYRVVKLQ